MRIFLVAIDGVNNGKLSSKFQNLKVWLNSIAHKKPYPFGLRAGLFRTSLQCYVIFDCIYQKLKNVEYKSSWLSKVWKIWDTWSGNNICVREKHEKTGKVRGFYYKGYNFYIYLILKTMLFRLKIRNECHVFKILPGNSEKSGKNIPARFELPCKSAIVEVEFHSNFREKWLDFSLRFSNV